MNKFKLKFINSVLSFANELLVEKYRPFADFEGFGEDDLPSNNDVVFVFSQYRNSFEKLRIDNVIEVFADWHWVIDKKTSDIRTKAPKKTLDK